MTRFGKTTPVGGLCATRDECADDYSNGCTYGEFLGGGDALEAAPAADILGCDRKTPNSLPPYPC
ncbi:hypothetical protein PN462_06205 [Spirulina sp. CS-785/01]|nr:hypothetical protein [Spirulina sp. CS-785/01]MDB9312686.1 hypothetical protein [Spirulina sp. CS-785/01]